eukprot:TRINITY_DN78201_c0_g1_i1.p1 TRINITY_DN78201_c0_g1~~TRINITY_DN78201_c0_g1_i1.p1  ORF type:complete len:102 (-),score=12.85 TRINITY_DN78201_c0_g1_i1:64-369(-)
MRTLDACCAVTFAELGLASLDYYKSFCASRKKLLSVPSDMFVGRGRSQPLLLAHDACFAGFLGQNRRLRTETEDAAHAFVFASSGQMVYAHEINKTPGRRC